MILRVLFSLFFLVFGYEHAFAFARSGQTVNFSRACPNMGTLRLIVNLLSKDASVFISLGSTSAYSGGSYYEDDQRVEASLALDSTTVETCFGTGFSLTTNNGAEVGSSYDDDAYIGFIARAPSGTTYEYSITDGGSQNWLQFSAPPMPPTASDVSFSGTLVVGRELEGRYTYADADDDAESGTTFKWYRSNDASGADKEEISGAINQTYMLAEADEDKFISFEVTPANIDGTGEAVESEINSTPVVVGPAAPTDSTITENDDGTITVSGTGAVGHMIKVKFPDGTTKTQIVGADGKFSIASEKPQKSGNVEVSTIDGDNKEGAAAIVSYSDTTPPVQASAITFTTADDGADDGKVTASGKAEVGSTVEVTFPDGSTKTATVGNDGSFSVTSDGPQNAGAVSVKVTDLNGMSSTASVSYNPDTTSPEVKISGAPSDFKVGDSFSLNVEFNEDVTGLLVSELVVENGSASNLQGSGKTYTITITPTGKGDVSVQVPAGVAQDAANNGNNASNKLIIKNTTVEETQKVIAAMMASRANQLVANQPSLINAIAGQDEGVGSLNASGTIDSGNFDLTTNPVYPLWAKVKASWSTNGDVESRYVLGAVGAHYSFGENVRAGVMLEVDHIKSAINSAEVEGTGWLVGPYVVAKVPEQPLYFEGRVLWGQSDNKVTPFNTYTDKFKTDRLFASGRLAGDLEFERFTLTPNVMASYVHDQQKSYVDRLGNVIPEQDIELTAIDFGLDFSMPVDVTTGYLQLTGGVSGIYSHTNAAGFATSQVNKAEGGRARVDLGFDYEYNEFIGFDMNFFYDGIGQNDYESYGSTVGVKMSF